MKEFHLRQTLNILRLGKVLQFTDQLAVRCNINIRVYCAIVYELLPRCVSGKADHVTFNIPKAEDSGPITDFFPNIGRTGHTPKQFYLLGLHGEGIIRMSYQKIVSSVFPVHIDIFPFMHISAVCSQFGFIPIAIKRTGFFINVRVCNQKATAK